MLRITSLSFVLLALIIIFPACDQASSNAETAAAEESAAANDYDPELAAELGADDYGMKSYVLAFLKRGPNRDRSPEEAQALQRAHLDNIKRLAEAGKLVLAGPFGGDGDIRGIYVFDVKTVEEAEALTATDPAIQAGSLVMELHPWYGTAALLKLKEFYPRLAKKQI